MKPPSSSPGTSRQLARLSVGPAFAVVGLFVLGLTIGHANQAARSGEELYIDRFGCWNCHGQTGTGGAGPSILKSQLPLRKFVQSVRLPTDTMPRFSQGLASDADLAIVYRWLDGVEAVETPLPVAFTLKASAEVAADGQKTAETEVALTARAADTASGIRNAASLRYRLTLAQANAPVANRKVECQLAGRAGWSAFTTDEHGEALLGPDQGFVLLDAPQQEEKQAAARLRVALAPGRYALLLEALDEAAAGPVVVGIGTAILNVE
ncbi:MAG: hypothetical protein A3H97_24950 [Acidobacteria bacterium RIFCSPLOWO2_02_FULL_65_29]|nr:MAG: hypothetical protein A3H97_24950 [Acidobacteria bacterium RIFCSPLOWO2_02_FULL_65_29]